MREGDLVFCAYGLPNDDLRNVVKFIPVIILLVHISIEWLEFRSTGNRNIQRLGCKE